FAHPLWILLLAQQKRFVLHRFLAFARTGIFANDRVPIGERAVVILIGLKRFSSSRVSGRGKRAVRKRLHEKSERLDDSVNIFHLKITGTELIRGFGAKFRRKLRRAQLGKDRRRAWIILLFVKGLGLEKFRLIGPFRGRIGREICVHFRRQGRRIGIVDVEQPLECRVLRFLAVRIFLNDLGVERFG